MGVRWAERIVLFAGKIIFLLVNQQKTGFEELKKKKKKEKQLIFWYLPKTKRRRYEMNNMTCKMSYLDKLRYHALVKNPKKKTNWIRNLKIQFITVTVLYLTNENFISPHIQKNVFLNYNYVTRELCLNRKNLTLWQICLSWAEHQGLTHF